MDYIQFTKVDYKVDYEDKINEIITCNFWGTDRCSIHNGGHCENCNVFADMLAQLYIFENALRATVEKGAE